MRTNGLVDPPRLYLWKHADHRFYDFVRIVGPLTRQDGLKKYSIDTDDAVGHDVALNAGLPGGRGICGVHVE